VLCKKPLKSVSPLHTFNPLVKCLIKSCGPQVKQLHGIPLWHIGDSPFSDRRSCLSIIGQVIALQSLKTAINGNVIIGGISLEYPRTTIGEITLRHLFKSIDYFFIRGSQTRNHLLKLGVPQDKISTICDFAFHLDKKNSEESDKCSERVRKSDKHTIALIIRDYSHGICRENYIKNIKKLVIELERDYDLFFIPTAYSFFTPENDLIFLEQVLHAEPRQILNIKDFSPEEIISIFSNFDVVISARLHGAVYGALANVPTIHLYEDRKSLEVISEIFGEIVPLIKLSDFAGRDGLNEVVKFVKDFLLKKNEISSEINMCIKIARASAINELMYSFEVKRLLEMKM
jgi:polysaccharide pyruvyl transferase WcaK-like protein